MRFKKRDALSFRINSMTHETNEGSGGMVAIVAIVIIAGLAIAFFMYAWPMLQKGSAQSQQPSMNIQIKETAPILPTTPPANQ